MIQSNDRKDDIRETSRQKLMHWTPPFTALIYTKEQVNYVKILEKNAVSNITLEIVLIMHCEYC